MPPSAPAVGGAEKAIPHTQKIGSSFNALFVANMEVNTETAVKTTSILFFYNSISFENRTFGCPVTYVYPMKPHTPSNMRHSRSLVARPTPAS